MPTSSYDERAVEILFSTYWSANGWRGKPTTSPSDLDYAKSKGLMFDNRTFRHDEIVRAARATADAIDHRIVADAFLASLTTRELAYRSALGSFSASRWLPEHSHSPSRSDRGCAICGTRPRDDDEDLNVLNFERLKWGGVRHQQPLYAWFDLGEFRKLPPIEPKSNDREALKRVLEAASSQTVDARPSQLEKAIAGVFPSNKGERRVTLEILGLCGIFQPTSHPSFFQAYANMDDRAQPSDGKNDWSFPFLWWRGSDGVNAKALQFYFPNI